MKNSSLFLSFLVAFLTSCSFATNVNAKTVKATGKDVTFTVNASAITQIETCNAIIVNYTVGTPVSVKCTAPESIKNYVVVKCTNGTLTCAFKKGTDIKLQGRKVVVNVTAPAVKSLEASSAAIINVNRQLNVAKLDIEASSAASVNLSAVIAQEIDIEAGSAATVTIGTLKAEDVDLEAESSGIINVSGTLDKVEAEASSAASITIGGTCRWLDAEASSGATINASKARIGSGNLNASSGGAINVSKATGSDFTVKKSSGGTVTIK